MRRYIDADKAKNGVMEFVDKYGEIVGMFVTDFNILLERCAVDVQEVRHGRWSVETIRQYDLAYGATAYEPVYKCSCCGGLTESYLRLDEPIMPEDASFPEWCGICGAKMDEATDGE